jgi:hypothetical protein
VSTLDFFLYDHEGYFRQRNIMFETLVVHPKGGQPAKCLVYPIKNDPNGRKLGIVFPEDIMPATHSVRVDTDGTVQEARMLIVIKNDIDGKEYFVDPFAFRWNSSRKFCFVSKACTMDANGCNSIFDLFV